ncbi:F0F1 ATP synthase subunit epsilon [Oceanomicrobium pacificus]|uniref:ATP synthase epsilon chain n=1 Tax=Oceanomicrobium pacificus TaxID=2692916 RepID=A0A6B0TSD5_9RHOB|nr:F0F1 ATP synthase subunit epsilon [Oceanomicrobium pacificus]MXU64244.1 F0F1 ATP synthase subunit epsilon [Oceanomicrobium pacificus]
MADKMQFDLVSPERKLASLEADQVQLPGAEGDMTAMPNHAPFLTTLRPGLVRVVAGSEVTEYVITGGFAEISPEGATILAEEALPKAEATKEKLEAFLEKAKADLEQASDEAREAAALRVNDHHELFIRHAV